MTEKMKRRITAIFLVLAMAVGVMPTMSQKAYAEPLASITLIAAASFTFTGANEGYGEQAPYQATVRNEGIEETGALSVDLSGDDAAFTLSTDSISSISAGEESYVSVKPALGLNAGTYTAMVTISGSQVDSKSFNVSFTVSPADETYTATIQTYLNGTLTDVEGEVEISKDSTRITVPKKDDGIYETTVANGDYTIFIDGNSTKSLVVSGENKTVTLEYFTVEFSASTEGTAANGSIGASVDGNEITSGDKVLSGMTISMTASATDAASYTYAWSGAGTNGETTATLNFVVSSAINAACVITGSGTPIESPDYQINDEGYNWTGSDQTIVVSGTNDTLTIHEAPTAAIKIDVQSADGSEVTLDGSSIACANTTVVVSNGITLNLKDFDITAPTGSMEDWRLFTALLLKDSTTIDVSGDCNISGNCNTSGPWNGHGIASEQDNTTHITGSGTLNVTGGSASNGNGGSAINIITYTYGTETGAKLFIEDGVTVNATGGNSANNQAGSGINAGWGDVIIDHATVSAIGGAATGSTGGGGTGILASSSNDQTKGGNITVTDSTLTAEGGASAASSGGRGLEAFTDIAVSGGIVTVTGGNGYIYGAHGVFSYRGIITIENGTDLTAVGGDGTTNLGGVGLRAFGSSDSISSTPGIATISNTAGDVYIRGGKGVADSQRDSIMGKGIYIGTGNIGTIIMESGTSRKIKNILSGDDLYLVKVETNPADDVEITCQVEGTLGGSYTYHAVADTDGTACLWLPEGTLTLSSSGYADQGLTVLSDDTANSVILSKASEVTAYDSDELKTYMAASYVNIINLINGTTYTYDGTVVTGNITINGNGATIDVGTGVNDTIVKKEGNSVTGPVFLAVEGGSLIIKNVTLRDASTRILAAINVKTDGTLLLDGVTFEGFFANLSTDPYPTASNINGSHNNFGIHAEPGAISTTVKNCTFGSTNSFRNTIAIRNGTAVIKDNTFVGTATPERQNQTDGCEYAVYLYGGNCTVTGNDISGFDSVLQAIGYHSAGITTCPYYSLVATITGNQLYNNARGIDGVGAWHTYSHPADVELNGTKLTTSEDGFKIGEALRSANTLSSNSDGDIAISLDQNDYYVDVNTGVEYGPPVYFAPLIKVGSTTSKGATLNFDNGIWARTTINNAKSYGIQVSEDNGTTWKAASVTETLNATSTSAEIELNAGKTYLLRMVLVITANTRPVDSTDDVLADITGYSNVVSATITSGGGKNSSGGGSAIGTSGGVPVIVNGETKTAGTAQTTTDKDGRTTATVTVDSTKLESILASKEGGATVIIPVTGKADIAAGVLTGEMVKNMENREATLVVKTEGATYTLPAEEINIEAVSKQLGTNVSLKDITVSVSISAPSSQMSEAMERAVQNGGFTPVVSAVDYTVTCSYGGRAVDVRSFEAYVERTIAIPDGVDPSKITTGIVINPDGTTHHVPTKVTVIDGKYYAVINSLTNSTYSVVWNPITFSDMNNHWAKASVNNMGSRMVVSGVGEDSYEPDRDMTRAEFAAIMVRALGLDVEIGSDSFSDVPSSAWYSGYVKTAASYGIIKGYSDTAFGPNDKITREQAMAMLARAMKITGLNTELSTEEGEALLSAFNDSTAISAFAVDSTQMCLKNGIVSGRENNTLKPKAYITRAEVAAMIERLLQKSNLI